MKMILPTAIAIGAIVGALIKPNMKTPEYVSVVFENNHYTVEATKSAQIPMMEPKVQAYEEKNPVERTAPELDGTVQSMLKYIHQAESTSGKNTTPGALHLLCRNQGKWNELGYGGMALKICFDSEEEGMAKVGDWLKRHLEKFDGDVAKTLCYYNLGEEQINCKYYQKFIGGKI